MPAYPARQLYEGRIADGYDAVRATQPKWHWEFAAVENLVRSLPAGSRVLDIPCGTGRFRPLVVEHGCTHVGADISFDMIRAGRAGKHRFGHGSTLVLCDAERLPFRDKSFDYVLCMRFFNLLPPEVGFTVLQEAARVSAAGVFVQVRCRRTNPLLRMIPTFKRYARTIRGQRTRRESIGRPAVPGPGKRFALPDFGHFAAMVDRAGLAISRAYTTSRLLDPDPQRVYRLEHRAGLGR